MENKQSFLISIATAFVFLILALGTAVADAPTEEWNNTFGGMYFDHAYSVQQTSDGGYILAGDTKSFGAGSTDAWLIKTDSNGNETWNMTFGTELLDEARSVYQTSDGGYILGGSTYSFSAVNSDAWLIKTNSTGHEEWNKTFGGSDHDIAYSVQQTSDGGYILAGNVFPFGASAPDAWLIKTNSTGHEEWNKTFGGADYDTANSVQQTTSDGGYILGGSTRSFSAFGQYAWLIKTYSNGTEEWNKTYGGTTDYDIGMSAQRTSDGGYILAGEKNTIGPDNGSAWLIKTYANGTEKWNKTFGGINPDIGKSVQQTLDDGYILAGDTTSFGADNGSAWLIKTHSNGTEQWNKTIGGISSDYAYSVQQTADGGYILAGDTKSFGADNGSAWLIKIKGFEQVEPVEPIIHPQPNFDVPTVNPLLLIGMLGFAVVLVLRRKED